MFFYHNLSPIIFSIGPLHLRWYGLMFALGILLNYLFVAWIFKKQKFSLADLDSLILYLFFGLIIGARLGHIVFYNLEYFAAHPAEIFKIWHGGLASHGAAIGLFLAYWLWTKIHKQKFSKYVDALAMGVPITAIFVRIGNFFNAEIIGIPTNGNWGVIYESLGQAIPRHPVQIYESAGALLIFVIMFAVYKKRGSSVPKMFYMFLLLALYFSMRFVAEFWKERHIIPNEFPISMGQILSVLPLLIAAIYFVRLYLGRSSKAGK